MSTGLSPIERMIDAAMRCVVCGQRPVDCHCWEKCQKCRGTKRVGMPCTASRECYADHVVSIGMTCACPLPCHTRRECADAKGIKSPCRCGCHVGP